MFLEATSIEEFDSELFYAISNEARRQEEHIELIASENYASLRVLEAQGSILTNKYAEGYPGKRYYGGCDHVDVAEQLAIDRAMKLFGADYANVRMGIRLCWVVPSGMGWPFLQEKCKVPPKWTKNNLKNVFFPPYFHHNKFVWTSHDLKI